jgi:ribosome modulation factor
MVELDDAWRRGFKAGEVFNKHCPYTAETPQARHWFLGWNEGSSKTLGFPYKTFADRLQMTAAAARPLPLGIAALLDPAGLPPLRKPRRSAAKPRQQADGAGLKSA